MISVDVIQKRDALLADTDWLVQRHQEETELGLSTTLTLNQYFSLLEYRRDLRQVPQNPRKPFPSPIGMLRNDRK